MLNVEHTAYLLHVASMRALAVPDTTPIHKAADAQVGRLMLAIRYAFVLGRKAIGAKALEAAKTRQEALQATKGCEAAVRAALLDVLPQALQKALAAGGEAAARMFMTRRAADGWRGLKKPLLMKFDEKDPRAAAWVKAHGLELAKQLSETTRDDIKDAIARGFMTGDLRQMIVDVREAVGSTERASLIARTEAMRSVHAGQRELWQQAIDRRLLTGREQKVWISTIGCCPRCADVDGETIDMNETFSIGSDPPGHPMCRCSMSLQG